jgi:hypothetical protein
MCMRVDPLETVAELAADDSTIDAVCCAETDSMSFSICWSSLSLLCGCSQALRRGHDVQAGADPSHRRRG